MKWAEIQYTVELWIALKFASKNIYAALSFTVSFEIWILLQRICTPMVLWSSLTCTWIEMVHTLWIYYAYISYSTQTINPPCECARESESLSNLNISTWQEAKNSDWNPNKYKLNSKIKLGNQNQPRSQKQVAR
jgi:Ca2+/Na+ antiporter